MEMKDIKIGKIFDLAKAKLFENLQNYGNTLSQKHEHALMEILGAYSLMAVGRKIGRFGMPLFTGGGKTLSICCWLWAVHELGYLGHISAAVSASKVEALCDLKRTLIEFGIPAEGIGLLHSYKYNEDTARDYLEGKAELKPNYASLPCTNDNDHRPILLCTHNRIKGKGGVEEFNTFKSADRSLLIWDESLLRAESKGIRQDLLESALGWWEPINRNRLQSSNETAKKALKYARNALQTIGDQLQKQRKAPHRDPEIIHLPELSNDEIQAYKTVFGSSDITSPIRELFEVSQNELRVIDTGLQSGGFVQYDILVPHSLGSIIVLDASLKIRELIRLDKTIKVTARYQDNIVSYQNVTVNQIRHAAGRTSITKAFKDKDRLLIREITEIVKSIPDTEAVLFFTFKPKFDGRKVIKFKDILIDSMKAEGIVDDRQYGAIRRSP